MYTIKQAARRTGITIPTIRVWERRYGVVIPTRTAAGYRLYDDEAIARLNAMQQLIERDGWRPSQAAERIRTADAAELAEVIGDRTRTAATDVATTSQAVTPPVFEAIVAIVDAARSLDVRAIEATLDETFAAQRFEAAMDAVVFPALRAIGQAWERGELDVAREHAASETIRRRIAHYFDAAARGGGPTVVVGLPPGSHHELGAFAFAVGARRAGLDVIYLGADVPVDAWRQAVRDDDTRAVVIGIVSRADVRPATDVIRALNGPNRGPIAIGGAAADDVPDDLGVVRLPDAVERAVDVVRELIGGGS
jgi:DNA-binding transcriptional MerR regulator/methylmalonyl-CoA mutase cobalamin-binding subunit